MKHKMKPFGLIVSLSLLSVVAVFTISDISAKEKPQVFAGIEMAVIPAGETTLWMGKYEVTQKQYQDIMGTNPSGFQGKPDNPVEKVSWYDAVEFCNKLSESAGFTPYYTIDKKKKDPENKNENDKIKWTVTVNKSANGFRLPTSEEWEYGYRAGIVVMYFWGISSEFKTVDKYAVYNENSYNKGPANENFGTNKVGSKKPNAYGLYDMSGNVWEWCFDWHPDFIGSRRAFRGGSWSSDVSDLRASSSVSLGAYRSANDIGFRLVRAF